MTTCAIHNEPVAADVGLLCVDHFSRLRSRLAQLPAVAVWLEVNIAAGGEAGERVSGTREDPIPLRLDVLDLVGPDSRKSVEAPPPEVLLWEDGVCIGIFGSWQAATEARWAEIVETTDVDADVHRWRIGVTDKRGCDQQGAEALRAVVDYWAKRTWAEGGFPWPDRNDLVGLVGFLTSHLSWVAGQDWCVELDEDVRRASSEGHRVAPWREEIRRDRDPCARCGVRAVVLHLAAGESRCERHAGGCGRRQPLSEYVLNAVLPQTRRSA